MNPIQELPRRRITSWDIFCGKVPKHWKLEDDMTALANEALYFCRHRLKNPNIKMKVYIGYRSRRYYGRCMTKVGVIMIDERHKRRENHSVHLTLAHEIAHMAYRKHGIRHEEITQKIINYFKGKGLL